jgi:hypothetical protein
VIDAREPEILVRRLPKMLEQPPVRGLDAEVTTPYVGQQLLEFAWGHGRAAAALTYFALTEYASKLPLSIGRRLCNPEIDWKHKYSTRRRGRTGPASRRPAV